MKAFWTRRLPLLLTGLVGLLTLLCAVAVSGVTNPALIKQGFLQFSDTRSFQVSAVQYEEIAKGLAQYLDGKADKIVWANGDDIFNEKEMTHLADVRGIVALLKAVRLTGGGITLCVLAALYWLEKKRGVPGLLLGLWRGFSAAAALLLLAAAGLTIWACVDFSGMFWRLHEVLFRNSLWLMDRETDLLAGLMPEPFFVWYAQTMGKSLLPIAGMMLCLIIAWLKIGRKPEAKEQKA